MRIAVIGGGIGGLAAGVALQQRGFEAHVYEAAPELRPIGKGIWVPTNAMLTLERLGLADAVAVRGVPLQRIEVRDRTGRVLQAIDLVEVLDRFGRTTTSIMRSELQSVLAGALAPGTLHLRMRGTGVRPVGASAIVEFEGGTEVEADVVVGADGIRSTVREAVAPGATLRYSGQNCHLGIASIALPVELERTVWEVWGGTNRLGFSAVADGKVYWFAPALAPAGGGPEPEPMARLMERYAEFPAPVPAIVAATDPADVMRVDLFDLRPPDRWWRGRVVLLGDAAHAMTPNLGQGGAQAIEDAWTLAEALAAGGEPEAAFADYQGRRRPRATRIARTSWWFGQMAHLRPAWARGLRNLGLRGIPRSVERRQRDELYDVRDQLG
jgi:2-polyprenyl-6-methoxyphenol hydroxylase-like FAD-dependent oxidoreductase